MIDSISYFALEDLVRIPFSTVSFQLWKYIPFNGQNTALIGLHQLLFKIIAVSLVTYNGLTYIMF